VLNVPHSQVDNLLSNLTAKRCYVGLGQPATTASAVTPAPALPYDPRFLVFEFVSREPCSPWPLVMRQLLYAAPRHWPCSIHSGYPKAEFVPSL
jgi:hypothetical protein